RLRLRRTAGAGALRPLPGRRRGLPRQIPRPAHRGRLRLAACARRQTRHRPHRPELLAPRAPCHRGADRGGGDAGGVKDGERRKSGRLKLFCANDITIISLILKELTSPESRIRSKVVLNDWT